MMRKLTDRAVLSLYLARLSEALSGGLSWTCPRPVNHNVFTSCNPAR